VKTVSSYYFLMAQLPALVSAAALPVSVEAFRELAFRYLNARDRRILTGLTLEPARSVLQTGSVLVDRWMEHERVLRLALERQRAAKQKRDLHPDISADELMARWPETVQAARTAASMDNPLEAELFLYKIRSARVEALRGTDIFGSDAVFAYALLLMLRERRDLFEASAGRAAYTAIYNQILGE